MNRCSVIAVQNQQRGFISGNLSFAGAFARVHRYDVEAGTSERQLSLGKAHTESCRAVRFSPDGGQLVSASADKGTPAAWLMCQPAHILRCQLLPCT